MNPRSHRQEIAKLIHPLVSLLQRLDSAVIFFFLLPLVGTEDLMKWMK